MTRLEQKLKEALDNGLYIWVEVENSRWNGIPTYLDADFLEISCLGSCEVKGTTESYTTNWLIRINRITAVAYPTQTWDQERLNSLIKDSQ